MTELEKEIKLIAGDYEQVDVEWNNDFNFIAHHFAQWQKEHLWKDAQGDDLPTFDREVIVLCECHGGYKVSYGHRPNPAGWDGINPYTKEKEHFDVHTYDKGGWNIPDVIWWLDLPLPYERKEGEE